MFDTKLFRNDLACLKLAGWTKYNKTFELKIKDIII